jgi:hypothetical protein
MKINHQKISFIKSAIRIFGYGLLIWMGEPAAIILVISEFVGVWEEIGRE